MRTQSQRLAVELARAALLSRWCKIAPSTSSPFVSSSSSSSSSLSSAIMRRMPFPKTHRSFITGSNSGAEPNQLDAIFKQKWALRSKIRKALKDMSSIQRSQEDDAIQSIVLEAPWFKSCKSLCLYISAAPLREVDTSRILSEVLCNPSSNGVHPASRKKVYVPRVEDKFSNMKMLKVTNVDELVMSSMNILEPALLDSDGIQREDVMQACEPVDLVILPVALAYSVQIMDEGAIAVTPMMFLWMLLSLLVATFRLVLLPGQVAPAVGLQIPTLPKVALVEGEIMAMEFSVQVSMDLKLMVVSKETNLAAEKVTASVQLLGGCEMKRGSLETTDDNEDIRGWLKFLDKWKKKFLKEAIWGEVGMEEKRIKEEIAEGECVDFMMGTGKSECSAMQLWNLKWNWLS
ncbi:hypothetical protein ACH5RR_030619 [Cinchona calisaya]|uniref:5-formyltetrahydrofolate cyclo-ligase n=1 Tax=Cinchona calisaya TaxID=153742 RepID=A0ABD2Z099_9GENT